MPPRLLLRGVLQPPAHLHQVRPLVEVLQAVVLAELLHLQVRAQVPLLHLRSLLQPQTQTQTPIQPPALHRAVHLVRVTDAI
jgi:hypothetical protein